MGALMGVLWYLKLGGQLGKGFFFSQLGTVERELCVLTLKHFWDALQTFLNIWRRRGLLWMSGTSQCELDCE